LTIFAQVSGRREDLDVRGIEVPETRSGLGKV